MPENEKLQIFLEDFETYMTTSKNIFTSSQETLHFSKKMMATMNENNCAKCPVQNVLQSNLLQLMTFLQREKSVVTRLFLVSAMLNIHQLNLTKNLKFTWF